MYVPEGHPATNATLRNDAHLLEVKVNLCIYRYIIYHLCFITEVGFETGEICGSI